MDPVFVVQAYKAKGPRLVGQASVYFAHPDEALAEGARLAPWRVGMVVFMREVDDEGVPQGRPVVIALHGRVPDGWFTTERAAA